MNVIAYAAIAVLVILVVAALYRSTAEDRTAHPESDRQLARGLWEGSGLTVAEKIFDRTDYLWLRNEVGFPSLARALARSRQKIALQWLRALRKSFDELVLTGPLPADQGLHPDVPGIREIFWPALRFHLLLFYATLVVRWLGPYHRLIPPVAGFKLSSIPDSLRQRVGAPGARDIP